MALQAAICTNCNGKIKVDDVDLNGYSQCIHCKTSHKVIDVITIDGLPTAKSLLSAARFSMQDGKFEKAVKQFNEIIELKPNCHEAWWGLYQCNAYFDAHYGYKDKYGNDGPHTKAQILQNTLQRYAYRAIEYAPEEDGAVYRTEIHGQVEFVEAVSRGDFDKKKGCLSGLFGG